jgi:hypothetical protein
MRTSYIPEMFFGKYNSYISAVKKWYFSVDGMFWKGLFTIY